VMAYAREHGVLILQAGPDVLRFLPPLNITAADLQEGLTRLAAAVARFVAHA
jgi:acetylornithine/N-succinyldiaminopimelate aminotransferase